MASQHSGDDGRRVGADRMKAVVTEQPQARRCPRCNSESTKFCYYNNYSQSQPRHFCKACRRYWTQGGALRNIPVGGSSRRYKRPRSDVAPTTVPHQLIVPSSTTTFSRPPPYFLPAPTTSAAGPGFFSSLVALQSANQLDPIQTFWDNNNFLHGINYFGTGGFTGQKPAAYFQMPKILIAGADDDPWNTNAAAGQNESADDVKPDLPGAEGSNEN